MKYSVLISFAALLTMFSCKKEIIVPVQQDTEEIMNTRGSTRDPETGGGGENGSVTDPDNETGDDKIKKKKKAAN